MNKKCHKEQARALGAGRAVLACGMALLAGFFGMAGAAWGANPPSTQQSMGVLPPRLTAAQVSVSPDGQRFAYVRPGGWKLRPVIDGVEQPPCDWVVGGRIAFSADSRHSIYQAKDRRKTFMVLDGTAGAAYEVIDDWLISPAGRLGFSGQRQGRSVAVIDGQEGPEFDAVRMGAIADAPGRVAYVASVGREECVVVDGTPQKRYERVAEVRLSRDGQHLAYKAIRGGKWIVVADGLEGRAYDQLGAPAFSPDGKRLGYAAVRGGQYYFVVDGVESRPYELCELTPPTFSADSRHCFYVGARGGRAIAVLDGRELAEHAWVHPRRHFSPAGQRLAYIAGTLSGRSTLMLEGKAMGEFDAVMHALFSPDGKRLAFVASRGGSSLVVVDGQEGKVYESIEPTSLTFSLDGRHVAFVARQGGKSFVVLDGREGQAYQNVLVGERLGFDASNALHFFATRQGAKPAAGEKSAGAEELLKVTVRP